MTAFGPKPLTAKSLSVQVRLTPDQAEALDRLCERLQCETRVEAIRWGLHLAELHPGPIDYGTGRPAGAGPKRRPRGT